MSPKTGRGKTRTRESEIARKPLREPEAEGRGQSTWARLGVGSLRIDRAGGLILFHLALTVEGIGRFEREGHMTLDWNIVSVGAGFDPAYLDHVVRPAIDQAVTSYLEGGIFSCPICDQTLKEAKTSRKYKKVYVCTNPAADSTGAGRGALWGSRACWMQPVVFELTKKKGPMVEHHA